MMEVDSLNEKSRWRLIMEAFNSLKMSDEDLITYNNLKTSFTKYGVKIKKE